MNIIYKIVYSFCLVFLCSASLEASKKNIPIGITDFPKHKDAIQEKEAKNLGLNFIVLDTRWIETKPGEYVWKKAKKATFLARLKDLKKKGFVIALTLTNVHMDQKHLPAYLKGKSFKDAKLNKQWAKFMSAFLKRHGPYIDYLNIGNEVNWYFSQHKDEWKNYIHFFKTASLEIKKYNRGKRHKIKVGTIFVEDQRKKYWQDIQKHCDYMGITYYTPCSAFGKDPTANALKPGHSKYS